MDYVSCNASTSAIGMPSHWGIFSGCRVQLPDGTWLPLENYRYMAPEGLVP